MEQEYEPIEIEIIEFESNSDIVTGSKGNGETYGEPGDF